MNCIDRLTAIILLLQGGKRTAGEIARRFEVSRRTVFRDIEALCEMGVPIVTGAGVQGGYELMPDYSLTPLQLTLREALLLRLALSSISQLADTPFEEERADCLTDTALPSCFWMGHLTLCWKRCVRITTPMAALVMRLNLKRKNEVDNTMQVAFDCTRFSSHRRSLSCSIAVPSGKGAAYPIPKSCCHVLDP